jgi:Fe2+ transport system protein FeoA
MPLSVLPTGAHATVARVRNDDPVLLQYLGTLGLVPWAAVTVESISPIGDVTSLRVGAATHAVGEIVTRAVFVACAEPAGGESNPPPGPQTRRTTVQAMTTVTPAVYDDTNVLEFLQAEQLVQSRRQPFGRRQLTPQALAVMWGLRIYAVLMLAVVAYQVVQSATGG